jgi:predicted metalloprotease with PDZ domain
MLKLVFILLLFFPVLLNAGDRYLVRFADDLSDVTIEACFNGAPPRNLYRHSKSALYTKWIRTNGKPINNRSHYGRLRLPDLPDDACIQWRVNLAAAVAQNDSRLALRLQDALLTSGSLWFWRDDEHRAIRVEVELPPGFSISTPWKERQENGRVTYWPDRTPASWSSRIAVGRFPVKRVAVTGTEIRLSAIGGLLPDQREAITEWVSEAAECVASIIGLFPQQQPQILVVAIGKRSEAVPWAHVMRGGGVAAEFFIDETRPINEFRSDWTATHELSHMLLPSVSSRDRWLSEGLASYYQNVLRARDGRLTEEQAWQKLHSGFERGKRATRGDSLAKATRSGRGATMRVYWSGAAIMLKADTQLRELTGGRQSIDTALSSLQDCCFEQGRNWRAQELFRELDRLTGYTVFMDLFHEHVLDDEFPDMSWTYAQLGIVPRSASVQLNPDAPLNQIRYQIMHDHHQGTQRYPFPGSTPRPQPEAIHP